MQSYPFDHLLTIDSAVRRWRASTKGAGSVILLVAIASVPFDHGEYLIPVFLALVAVIIFARLPALFLLKRIVYLEPFALAAASLALFHPLGWMAFAVIVAKSTASLLTVVVLSATTPFSDLLQLLRRIGLPVLLVGTIALLYRYLFLLSEEAMRMRTAREARTMRVDRKKLWFLQAGIVGQLIVRSMNRADRVYAAMRARGWS